MRALQLAHMILTTLLLGGVTVFGVLLLVGRIEVRERSAGVNPERHPSKDGGPKARLLVLRGLRPNWEYAVYEGDNFIGRADEQPVDIDLQPQEPEDRVWSSRQHAVIRYEGSAMVIEDLNSANGTYVNRKRVPPGERQPLREGDIVQIGAVQLKVVK